MKKICVFFWILLITQADADTLKTVLRVDIKDGKILNEIKTSQEGSHMVVSTADGKKRL